MTWRHVLILCAAVIAMMIIVRDARSHSAPLGWSYDYQCCSGLDCRQISSEWIREETDGYVMPTGEVIPYSSSKIHQSGDEFYHWCTVGGSDNGKTLCLYVPNRGF